MTVYLEQKWSKEEIFATYANQIYLGEQAAYSIHGFSQAADLFFGKELRDLTLPEAALLAGMVQRPSYFNPVRNPDRARERRNLVLAMMKTNGYITDAQYRAAAHQRRAPPHRCTLACRVTRLWPVNDPHGDGDGPGRALLSAAWARPPSNRPPIPPSATGQPRAGTASPPCRQSTGRLAANLLQLFRW